MPAVSMLYGDYVKNLKINTTISMIIGLFAITLLLTTSFFAMNGYVTKKHLNYIVVAASSDRHVRDAAYNITASIAHINSQMLQTASGKTISQDMVHATDEILGKARQSMDDFMTSSFNSEEERKVATEILTTFNRLYAVVVNKSSLLLHQHAIPAHWKVKWRYVTCCARS